MAAIDASGGTWGSSQATAEWLRGANARTRNFGPATERMLDLVDLRDGHQVLDIGAGAGDTSLAAARRVAPNGKVLATDISASMLKAAAATAERLGIANVETRVMDAQRLELEPSSFDVVISRFALMLVPDIGRALTEMWRVLRSSGKVAAIVFSTPEKCPFLSIPHQIARRVGRLTFPPEPFGEFRLAAPGVFTTTLAKAGFRDITIHNFPAGRQFPSLADAIEYAKSPLPLRELTNQLTDVQRAQAWTEIERSFTQFMGPDGYDAPCEFLIGVATK